MHGGVGGGGREADPYPDFFRVLPIAVGYPRVSHDASVAPATGLRACLFFVPKLAPPDNGGAFHSWMFRRARGVFFPVASAPRCRIASGA